VPDIIGQLQQFRREHGLAQEQVARTIGVSVVTVNRWESRRSAPSARSAERIGQLINRRRAPASPSADHHLAPLAADPTPFTGRSRELSHLLAIWPHQRLLTLTGPGGIGKSRLAAELLRRASQCPLASVRLNFVPDPVLALAEIAAVLGLRVPAGPRAETLISAALQEAEGVLFLDGCEHVVSGLRGLLGGLVSRAPGLRVLATSRVPVLVPGERVWPVPGLDCLPAAGGPNSGAAAASEAALFFLDQARADGDGFPGQPGSVAAVGRLCGLLDGMPLALSLAAGRAGSLSLEEMIIYWEEHARLLADPATRYERHQVAGSAVEWSAALLSQGDRRLFGDLSVFAGPFGLEDVGAITPELSGAALSAAVDRLVRLSWVAFAPGGGDQPYQVHSLLRDWAHRELARTGRADPAYRRHALFVRDFSRQAEASHFRVDRGNWSERLGRAVGDIQSALHWACGADLALGAEIATSLLGWWRSSGRITGGRYWLRACRDRPGGLPEAWLARASVAEALLAVDQGEYREAERLAVSAWPTLEAAGDVRWLSRALIARSAVAARDGHAAAARQYLTRAIDYQASRGDLHDMALSLGSLGRLEADAGYLRRARESYQRALTLTRELDDDRLTATALANLAAVATLDKRSGQARLLLEEAMTLADRGADDHVRATLALGLAENLLSGKDYPAAITHFRMARDRASASGDGRLSALAICGLGRALYAHGHEIDGRNLLLLGEELATKLGDHLVLGKARDALQAVTRIATGPKLTKRETEIIRLVDKGESDRAIAGHLGIAVPTVRRHLENIFAKLNTRSRGAAAAIWRNLP
jgi:predicted ATPase/DNA-binding CsgD family transcriptional regulator/DNA-binding XRE family transcriptional regulator